MAGFRRPSPALTALTLLAFVILCALGAWQLERRAEKAALIDLLAARAHAPPIDVPAGPIAEDALDYRVASVTGRFDHAREMLVYGRSDRGEAGVGVVTPLRRADGRGVVLVDRGFVPIALRDPTLRAGGQVEGDVTVTGVLRLPGPRGWLTPANDAARNAWFRLDPAEMGAAAQVPPSELAPYVLVAGAGVAGGPVGRPASIDLTANHLHYALTWFALALALPVMFVLYHRRPASPAGESS